MKVNLIAVTLLFTVIIISGCAPRYSCKEVIPGTRCASLSEVYDEQVTGIKSSDAGKEVAGIRESVFDEKQGATGHKTALVVASKQQRNLNSVEIVKGLKSSGQTPILRPPKIVRIWVAPWVDGNEDLNMDTYIYTEIREKKWILGGETSKNGASNMSAENIGRIINALE